ncbi:MAG: polysaccharide biosynthesis/export family protein [Deltaproteobacteria bacterium]|jgi:polysaccharide export outer membrane protein|nr:polysaccharide biosynthesis/export family protein [Deltaproteobacteria bacterium]
MKRLAVIFMAVSFLVGCAATGPRDAATPEAQQGLPTVYRIAPGDVLSISVYGEKAMNEPDLVVRPDGKVTFPLVGDIAVGGETTARVKRELDEKLHKYIPEAVATVSVKALGSLQYYVVGEVNKPGMFDVSTPVTVLQALALAGGLTIFADDKHIEIVRNRSGKVTKLPFDYKQVVKGKNLNQNIVLRRGDTVVVP